MRPGVATPSNFPLALWEVQNLAYFHRIHPTEPRVLYHDPENRIVVMEGLEGSYHTRLSEHYRRFFKLGSPEQRRHLQSTVVREVKDILHLSTSLFLRATQEVVTFDPHAPQQYTINDQLLAVRPPKKDALVRRLKERLNYLYNPLVFLTKRDQTTTNTDVALLAAQGAFAEWHSRTLAAEELQRLGNYLNRQELLSHLDLRPENVLFKSEGTKTAYAVCDLTDIAMGPANYDVVSFLMDPRLNVLLSLQERQKIHNEFFAYPNGSVTLAMREKLGVPPSLHDNTSFLYSALSAVIRDIGATFAFIYNRDPSETSRVRADIRQLSSPKNLPLPTNLKFLAVEYITLCHLLTLTKQSLPDLYEGVLSLCPDDAQRRNLESRLLDEENRPALVRDFHDDYLLKLR